MKKSMLKIVIYCLAGIVGLLVCSLLFGLIINLREISLDEALAKHSKKSLTNPVLDINRKQHLLRLYDDTLLVKEYRASFGRNTEKKTTDGDFATPEGEYKICANQQSPEFTLFLKINYPNDKDIAEAYRMRRISQLDYENLRYSFFYKKEPDFSPVLGGNVGIHGTGRLDWFFRNLPFAFNWTDGSISLANEDIAELARVIKIGTIVKIR